MPRANAPDRVLDAHPPRDLPDRDPALLKAGVPLRGRLQMVDDLRAGEPGEVDECRCGDGRGDGAHAKTPAPGDDHS